MNRQIAGKRRSRRRSSRRRTSNRRPGCNRKSSRKSCKRKSKGKKRCSRVKRSAKGMRKSKIYCKRGGFFWKSSKNDINCEQIKRDLHIAEQEKANLEKELDIDISNYNTLFWKYDLDGFKTYKRKPISFLDKDERVTELLSDTNNECREEEENLFKVQLQSGDIRGELDDIRDKYDKLLEQSDELLEQSDELLKQSDNELNPFDTLHPVTHDTKDNPVGVDIVESWVDRIINNCTYLTLRCALHIINKVPDWSDKINTIYTAQLYSMNSLKTVNVLILKKDSPNIFKTKLGSIQLVFTFNTINKDNIVEKDSRYFNLGILRYKKSNQLNDIGKIYITTQNSIIYFHFCDSEGNIYDTPELIMLNNTICRTGKKK